MKEDRAKSKPKDDRSAEESLNEALDDLERILEQRRQLADDEAATDGETPPGGQYDIPLLNDVIVPGEHAEADYDDENEQARAKSHAALPAHADYEAVCQMLVTRIASEIEVIVQSRIEAALENATDEIRQQVRNHIEIMLPEILEEIIHSRDREDG